MVNDCIRLSLPRRDFAYESVKRACRPRMDEYPVEDSYRISAMFEASNLLKKYLTDSRRRKVRPPHCRRPYLAASLGVWLEGNSLLIPGNERISLTPHTVTVLSQPEISVKSATLTPTTCSVVYRKWVKQMVPAGMVAVDLNLDNITTFDTEGISRRYDLSDLTTIHETYRRIKSRFRRNDVRIKGELFRKYASIEGSKKSAIIHRVSSEIVHRALGARQAIALEDLRGIRDMYRKRSGYSPYYLSKMNAWPFFQILRAISYKAEWLGLPVPVLSPEWTSEKCSECTGRMDTSPVDPRDLVCLDCGLVIDRDLNAAKNLLRRGLRSWLGGFAKEAMIDGKASERSPNAGADANHPGSEME